MRWVPALLLLGGCTLASTGNLPGGQPVFVLGNPVCFFWCSATVGNSQQDVDGGVAGAQSLQQSSTLDGGRR